MSELRTIATKHKAIDAAKIRRAVAELEPARTNHPDVLQVLLYLTDLARRIDDAFRATNVVPLRASRPEPPDAA